MFWNRSSQKSPWKTDCILSCWQSLLPFPFSSDENPLRHQQYLHPIFYWWSHKICVQTSFWSVVLPHGSFFWLPPNHNPAYVRFSAFQATDSADPACLHPLHRHSPHLHCKIPHTWLPLCQNSWKKTSILHAHPSPQLIS